jgi:hypothetical protein
MVFPIADIGDSFAEINGTVGVIDHPDSSCFNLPH